MSPDRFDAPLQRLLTGTGVALTGLGAMVLIARLAGWKALVTIVPGGAPMAAITALGFLLGGAGLLGLGRRQQTVAQGAALAMVALGGGVLIVYLFAAPLGWTTYIYNPLRPIISTGVGLDGRMSPNAAGSFLVLGAALWMMARGWWWPRTMIVLGAALLAVASLALVGYFTGLRTVSPWWRYTAMAVHTAAAFWLAAVVVIAWVVRRTPSVERTTVRAFPFFAIAAATMVVLGLIVIVSNDERDDAARTVRQTLEVKLSVERFIGAMARMDTGARNFALTGDERYVERIAVHHATVQAALGVIGQATMDNPAQVARVAALHGLAEQNYQLKVRQIAARRAGGVEAAVTAQRAEPPEVIAGLRAGTDGLLAEEDRLLALREEKSRRDEQRLRGILVAGGGTVLALLGGAFALVSAAKQRLREANEQLEERVAQRTREAERASAEARELEARFRAALVDSPVPVMVWAGDGRILLVNRVWRELTGYTEQELKTIGDWTERALGRPAPDDLGAYLDQRFAVFTRLHDGERQVRTKTGGVLTWDFHTACIGHLPDGVRLLVSKAVDVTAHREAEMRVRASESSYRFLADTMPQMVWTARPDGPVETFNRGWLDYTGLTRKESLGDGWLCVVHPEDVAACAEEWRMMLGEGRSGGGAYRLRRAADGQYRWHLWRAHPQRDGQGQVERWVGTSTDIHEQKSLAEQLEQRVVQRTAELTGAQAELAANNRLQRAVLDGNSFSIIATRTDGVIEIFSRGAEQMLGYTAAEMVGRRTPALIHVAAEVSARAEELSAQLGRPVPAGFEAFVALARLGRPDEREWTYVRKDGSLLPVRLSISALRDPAGEITGFLGIAQDLTQRREAEVALQASEQRLLMVLKRADCLVWEAQVRLMGDDWDWHFVVQPSGLHERLFAGLPTGESAGLWYQFDVPERVEMNQRCREAILSGQTGYEQEFRLRREGTETWIRESVSISRSESGMCWLVGVATDITAQRAAQGSLRASEERFRQAFDYAGVGMAIVGLDGRWLRVNRTVCETVGYEEATLMTKTFQDITHPDDLHADLAHVESLLSGRRRFYAMEKRYFHREGSIVWVKLTVSLVRDAAGVPVHFVSQIEDITERKRLEKNLAVARDQALEASRMKSEFLANMSHEIRTPLNAVVGMSGLLADTELTADQQEMARTIMGGAEGLLTVINDILDFSKIEAGKLHVEAAEFDVRRVVEETVALLAPRAQEHGVEVACEFDPAVDGMVVGDGGRVRQVVTNLLGNAVKFTERGEIVVTVRASRVTAERVALRVSVRDTGVGIAPAARPKLFQPFTQEDASTTRRFGGTGLGLAISKQLVELMGGEIGFESEQGRGSTFWFQLELARGHAVPPPPPVALPPGRRVLVVDDNETNRRITLGQLARLGIEAEAVADGLAALARLQAPESGPWHAALLDWHMPRMSGLELAVELRTDAVWGDLPLVMLSSAGPEKDVATATAVGFSGFLTKPVSDGQLARCLARVLTKGTEAVRPHREASKEGVHLKILLVEDNPANQRVASMMLLKLGHDVDVAINGRQALERLEARDFDVVLMDCQMPVLDGYEATRRIRAGTLARVNPRIPVIALTAYAMAGDRAKCIAAGMDDHLTKPVRPADLLAALERCGFHGAIRLPSAARPARKPEPVTANQAILDEEMLASARTLPGTKGPSLLPELVEMYLSDERERLERLQQLAAERAEEDLAQEAHAFAGNAASFGGMEVRRTALELERAAQAGGWTAIEARLADLRTACERLRGEIVRLNLLDS